MGTFRLCLINGVVLLPHLDKVTLYDEKRSQFQFYGNIDQVVREAEYFENTYTELRLDILRMHKYIMGDKIMGFIPVVAKDKMEGVRYEALSKIY